MDRTGMRKFLFCLCAIGCFLPVIGTSTALVGGMLFSLLLGNPWSQRSAALSKIALQLSVVGLGFGLSLGEVLQTGKNSFAFTLLGISFTLITGYLLGRLYGTAKHTSTLISFGTAICGGSAIAALAPVLKAKDDETAVALATVFTLNSVALLLFPVIGHTMHLSQDLFGTWAGLAIHDTSSVVGAAAAYGAQALSVGTTVKLTRAIWITPAVMIFAWLNGSGEKVKVPLFIIGFILAAATRTLLPQFGAFFGTLTVAARQCLVFTLFLIGAGLTREVLAAVGLRPFMQGVTLWLLVSSMTLAALLLVGIS